ncbi:hypothetical protein C1H46_005006 [Malus baccata]|uniref:Uncharacterized protein n=1 Tax=Malus baccata TaxID=106549 RepID=A0A540NEA6_MALBA|nr:hypothetical protein C1H46_005006 [Malus baccata]
MTLPAPQRRHSQPFTLWRWFQIDSRGDDAKYCSPHVAKTATAADPCRYDLGFSQGILGIDTLSLSDSRTAPVTLLYKEACAPKLAMFCLPRPKIKSFIFKDGGGLEVDDGDTNEEVSIPKIPCLKPMSYRHRSADVAVLATGDAISGIVPGRGAKPCVEFHGEPWKPNSDLNKGIGRECQRNGDGSVIGRHGGGGDSKAGESKRLGGRGSDSEKKIGGEGEDEGEFEFEIVVAVNLEERDE